MKTAKSWFSLVMALLPVLFFGGFFLYFSGVNNAFYGLLDSGLGPTRMGLGALTILFALLFLWKLYRFSSARPPAPKAGGPETDLAEAKSDFDADAAMARYLARRGAGGPAVPASRPTATVDGVPVRPGGFGRKGNFQ